MKWSRLENNADRYLHSTVVFGISRVRIVSLQNGVGLFQGPMMTLPQGLTSNNISAHPNTQQKSNYVLKRRKKKNSRKKKDLSCPEQPCCGVQQHQQLLASEPSTPTCEHHGHPQHWAPACFCPHEPCSWHLTPVRRLGQRLKTPRQTGTILNVHLPAATLALVIPVPMPALTLRDFHLPTLFL